MGNKVIEKLTKDKEVLVITLKLLYLAQGEVIAAVGSMGDSTGPHLHFEIRKDGSSMNPYNYIQ